jgi:hypothetical protein
LHFQVDLSIAHRFARCWIFLAEQLFKLTSIRWWADHKGGIVVKAAIGGQNMQMGIKILKIAKALHVF